MARRARHGAPRIAAYEINQAVHIAFCPSFKCASWRATLYDIASPTDYINFPYRHHFQKWRRAGVQGVRVNENYTFTT